MPVSVRIPTPLRKFTNDQSDVEIDGASVGQVIDNLEAAHGGIKEKLVDDDGSIRRFVNIYVNDEDIRFLDGADTEVRDGDSVTIVPAIAGGCWPGDFHERLCKGRLRAPGDSGIVPSIREGDDSERRYRRESEHSGVVSGSVVEPTAQVGSDSQC